MPDWKVVDRSHVIAAIADCDRLGSKEFLRRHGFGRARSYMLWHHGEEYDAPAIAGVAYLHATGRPLTSEEFSEGEGGAARVLHDLGFDVVEQEEPVQPTRQRTAKPKARKTASTAPTVKVCPNCHMALPASGICDYCD